MIGDTNEFDFEHRIISSENTETIDDDTTIPARTYKTISELPFSDNIKKQILSFTNNIKTKSSHCGCVITSCPMIFVDDILFSISTEIGTTLRSIDFNNIEKEGDLAAILTNSYEGDLLAIKNIEKIKPVVYKVFWNALANQELIFTIGKGASARTINLPIPTTPFVIVTDDRKNVPLELYEEIYNIIDFGQHKTEARRATSKTTLEKYGLTITDDALEMLSKLQLPEHEFIAYLFDIRNKAFDNGVEEITIGLLNNAYSLPEIEVVNQMDGREFELFTGDLFRALGYSNINVTQTSCDFGADVIAEKDDVRFAIQCKRYSAPVGVSAVQEVLASKSLHDCHVACILTNNAFTPAAEELAKKNLVILWGGDKLKEFIERAKK